MTLETELATFDELRDKLVASHEGQYALIHDGDLLGTYTTFAEAYEAGVRSHGLAPFLVRQIAQEDPKVFLPALNAGVIFAR